MIDAPHRRRLSGQMLYVLLGLAILFVRLLPLAPGAVTWPGPDMLLCLTIAWVLRRPEQVPVLIIAALFLVENMVLQRPPGLWAAIIVVATEATRLREGRWREQAFLFEWLRVAALILAMLMADRLVQVAFFVPADLSPRPPLGQVLLQFIATVAAYPVVVWTARMLVGLRHATPGENEMAGR